jgi:hypothetical protein
VSAVIPCSNASVETNATIRRVIMGSKGRKNVKKPKQEKAKGTAAPEPKKK